LGKITVVIPDELEERLRAQTRKLGDLGRFVSEALEDWLRERESGYRRN
jgi:predicted DNA-binding protein